jgi:hypothetical protein
MNKEKKLDKNFYKEIECLKELVSASSAVSSGSWWRWFLK